MGNDLIGDLQRREDERRLRSAEVVARVLDGAMPLVGAIDAALSGGTVTGFQAVLNAGAVLFLRESIRRAGEKADLDKCGYELPLQIAAKGAGKGSLLRGLWQKLLTNAIDKDFEHQIRHEDVVLMDSLNPSDAILVYMIGRYAGMMSTEWRAVPEINKIETTLNASRIPIASGLSLKVLRHFTKTALGNDLAISDDELRYALTSRGRQHDHPDTSSTLFVLQAWDRGDGTIIGTSISGYAKFEGNARDSFVVTLSPRAKRLVTLIGDK